MTTAVLSIKRTEPYYAHGWIISFVCHVLGVWSAVLLMAEISKPVLPTTFRWEVAMVETPASIEPVPPQAMPAPPAPYPVDRMDPRPMTKPMVPVQQAAPAESREPVRRITRAIMASAPSPEPIHRNTDQVVVRRAEPVIERHASSGSSEQTVLAAVVRSAPNPVMEKTGVSTAAVPSVQQLAEPIDGPTAIDSLLPTKLVEAVERESHIVEAALPAVERRVMQSRQIHYRETKADYSWLRDALWSRIEQLKRYPAQARMNQWEGKVVVEAVIREDGTVVGLKIAETSGRAVLDQEALTVMQKASPLTLKHPLGQAEVTILIPISYRLDG